jgi:class 3 adenylate cyclase
MPDGSELEIGPGDVFEIPPGHDAWVVGDAHWISVDWEAMRNYARDVEERRDRRLATILFTDIVGSTQLASSLGPETWRERIAVHNERAQRSVHRQDGRLVQTTGDGILAVFDGTERAVQAARGIREAVASPPLELQIRAGVETGDVEFVSGDVRGLAVNAAARITALAGPGEILVSGTVRELLAGSGIGFEDRGEHELKGLETPKRVFAVVS